MWATESAFAYVSSSALGFDLVGGMIQWHKFTVDILKRREDK